MEHQEMSRLKLAVLLFGVFVTSFGVLSFEISLTRVFSIMLDYHYTFLVVSIALFGLGLGGVIAQYISGKSSKANFALLALLAATFSLSTTFLTLFAISSPDMSIFLQVTIMFLPFLVAGTLLALTYKIFVRRSSILHFADLVGAALGSLAVVFLINWEGAPAAILSISLVTLFSSLFFSLASKKRFVLIITVFAILGMGLFAQYSLNSNIWKIEPASSQGKELSNFISDPSLNASIIDSRWSSFGQVDLVSSSALPHEKVIFVDGGAGTTLYHFNGDFNSTDSTVSQLRDSTQFFPYLVADKGNSLVIGPGGGLDVLTALMGGVNHIYAVEVNPSIVNIVKDYSSYDGGIYTNYSNVHLAVDEGRSFLKRSDQKYDTIVLDIPVSKTSQGTFGYALAENYLFTIDSFKDYLNHLNDDGFLAVIAHNPQEIYKLTSVAFQVLSADGLYPQQIMQQIAVVGSNGHMDHSSLPIFLLKKTPITTAQASSINTAAAEKGFATLYTPVGTSTDPILTALAKTEVHITDLVSDAPFNMNAPTDDNPFFYNFELGIPSTLVLLLAGAIVLVATVSVAYVIARRRQEVTRVNGVLTRLRSKFSIFKWFCFASLGLGFMLIEIALIQKFILFLGEPTLAIAASLFSLLLAGGVGSFFSRRWSEGKQYNAFKVSLIIGAMAIAYIFVLPAIFNVTLSYSTSLRFLISFVLVSPVGFLMGIPFPTILGYIKQEFENDSAWMWCINGAFSVLAGVLSLIIAMMYGFNAVLVAGASTYFALYVIGRLHEQDNKTGKIKWVSPQAKQFRTRKS